MLRRADDIALAVAPAPKGDEVAAWAALLLQPRGAVAPLALLTLMRSGAGVRLVMRSVRPYVAANNERSLSMCRSITLPDASPAALLVSSSRLAGAELCGASIVPACRTLAHSGTAASAAAAGGLCHN